MARDSNPQEPIKDAALSALKKLLEPMFDLMFDSGVTVHEFTRLLRDGAVHNAAKRVRTESGRSNNSRVAIMTGLPRSEVARSLRKPDSARGAVKRALHPSRRVLAAWHDDPRYLTQGGAPAVVPIFGPTRSFERLVAAYGGGIPVRAMLDELVQTNAVERLSAQKVRVKARVPLPDGLSATAVDSIGARGNDLLATLTSNLHRPDEPLFAATAQIEVADFSKISTLRSELTAQGSRFIDAADDLLDNVVKGAGKSPRRREPKARCRLGVTVYYFQEPADHLADHAADPGAQPRRKNLRRQHKTKKPAAIAHRSAKVCEPVAAPDA